MQGTLCCNICGMVGLLVRNHLSLTTLLSSLRLTGTLQMVAGVALVCTRKADLVSRLQASKFICHPVSYMSFPAMALQKLMMLRHSWRGLATKYFSAVCTVWRLIEPCKRCKHGSYKVNSDMRLL